MTLLSVSQSLYLSLAGLFKGFADLVSVGELNARTIIHFAYVSVSVSVTVLGG